VKKPNLQLDIGQEKNENQLEQGLIAYSKSQTTSSITTSSSSLKEGEETGKYPSIPSRDNGIEWINDFLDLWENEEAV